MVRGKEMAEWSRMSNLLALLTNINRGKNKRPAHPRDFMPQCFVDRIGKPKPKQFISPNQLLKKYGLWSEESGERSQES